MKQIPPARGARGCISSFLCPFALAITLCVVVELGVAFLVQGLGARRVVGGVGLLLGLALIALLLVEAYVVLERDHLLLRLQCGGLVFLCFLRRTVRRCMFQLMISIDQGLSVQVFSSMVSQSSSRASKRVLSAMHRLNLVS